MIKLFKHIFFLLVIICNYESYAQTNKLTCEMFFDEDSIKTIVYETSEGFSFEEQFYKNGQKKGIKTKFKGECHGVYMNYYDNGNVKSIEGYLYGVEIGTWLYFYPNGLKRKVCEYGFEKTDIYLEYQIDTILIEKANSNKYAMKDTLFSGFGYKKPTTCINYYPNGNIKSEEYFSHLKKCGVWKYYSLEGKLLKVENYNTEK
ncbi:MAG: hypothetical protein CFE21_00095 [Bacteroidetes bacterium B1(2017)]|nr:MAG: hypothetical protein CFE21_00095 [Bacteroidetes bacterium B1(2017)]